ncbi:High-affinity branched-chain amino acid transport ATP-binding protein LivF [subsurface metagenome]
MLKVNELDTYYGNLQILRKISLEVNDGELVTLIGANGAGKSTFLMAVSGMIKQTFGTIEFAGTSIDKLLPHIIVRLGIVQVPQGRLLFPKMTVLENLEIGARQATDIKSKSLEQRLEEVFSLFKVLRERRKQRAGTLSGGEQQMLAIARGLMGSPKLLMLDEPSFGLAPIIVLALGRVISDLNARGLSILLVEQNAHLALELASRGYVLQSGAIVASGKTSELARSEIVKRAYLG